MAKFDAVFVGLTILDIAGRPVSKIPDGGGVVFIEEIRLNPAGTAAGAVMNAAKLGARTATVACLGADEKGDLILDFYRRLGIDCSLVQRTGKAPTSATILTIRPNGERPALHCRGASDHLFIAESEFDAVCDASVLHLGGTELIAAMDGGQSAKLLRHAKAKGLTTTFDLIAPSETTISLLTDLLPSVDYFMPSLEEAAFLSGRDDPADAAAFFMDRGAGACIFKMGAKGSYTRTRDGPFAPPLSRFRCRTRPDAATPIAAASSSASSRASTSKPPAASAPPQRRWSRRALAPTRGSSTGRRSRPSWRRRRGCPERCEAATRRHRRCPRRSTLARRGTRAMRQANAFASGSKKRSAG